ncbi:MAG: hypothetical protein H7Y06_09770, partial [Opitutaceae bacterium]|nr:hypothetical protein [Opitutaceae bacterium]
PRGLADWRSLLAHDPELVAAPIESLPLHHDFDDFGLYTARSGWDTDAAFVGLRCGPASAESATARLGFDFGESHLLPNQGDFSFFLWGKFILPGCEYPKLKLTSNHNVIVFEGRDTQAGRLVGQLGEGGPWFNAAGPTDPDRDYASRASTPRVLHREHTARYHHHLCELGGLYRLRDERAPDGVVFTEYTRSLVFLPDSAVAVVDRVRTPHPRTAHFRLLTALDRLTPDEHGFAFDLWGVPGRINDYSPVAFARTAAVEHLSAATNADQRVATLRAENVTEAVFAVVIGVGAGTRYRIVTDARGYDLLDGDGDNATALRVNWPATH